MLLNIELNGPAEEYVLKPLFPSPAAVSHTVSVSRSTAYRDARRTLRPYARPKIPPMSPQCAQRRLVFCNRMLRKPEEWFVHLVFSDEKYFTTNDCGGRFQWLPYRQRHRVLGREQLGMPPKIMVWGFIGVGIRHLVLVESTTTEEQKRPSGKRLSTKRSLDGANYIAKCLKPALRKLRGRVFQQDGATCHWTSEVQEFLTKAQVELLSDWAAGSPDLSPVENMWALVQRALSDRAISDASLLWPAVLEEWNRIPQGTVDKLVLSFKGRCKECVELQGGTLRK